MRKTEDEGLAQDERGNRKSNPGDAAFVHIIGAEPPTHPPGKAKTDQGPDQSHPGGEVSSLPTQGQRGATFGG